MTRRLIPSGNIRRKTMFQVIFIVEFPDGEHVGFIPVDVSPTTVTDAELERHVRGHAEQRPHAKLVRWWRAKGPNDLADTVQELAAKYPNRPSLQEITGGQPTRALVDPTPFLTVTDDDEAEGSP
jgi:hypothetical protein